MLVHITDSRYVAGYTIWLRFSDGAEGEVDLSAELYGEVFEPLRDIEAFKKFRLDPEMETIAWPNGADIAPEFLRSKVTVLA